MKYSVKKEDIKIDMYVSYVAETGECTAISKQEFDSLADDQKTKFVKESFSFKHPTWEEVSEFSSGSTQGVIPIPNERVFDKFLIKYLLISTSFFEVERGVTEEDARDHVTNIDMLTGKDGVVSQIINFMLIQIRART